MIEVFFDGLGVVFLWLAVEYCLRRETAESLDEASMVPFADDPEVARRVELATGKSVKVVAPEALKPGWINLDM
ncbi:cbb3-type cytochrome c oxidase subunit 3 [Pseudomonas sp. 18058]|uniref:cbb3-type cytochrome c oxidase subunit 3 n=1 Tax=Pseudomonas sp. 18058 TaxID=2681406 RepID=UPI001359FD52|nr:cbb3-type cytochrome c oxidase subunit 3 [Pseudomonas sp. 18058]